jgi:hypothetical protein
MDLRVARQRVAKDQQPADRGLSMGLPGCDTQRHAIRLFNAAPDATPCPINHLGSASDLGLQMIGVNHRAKTD